MITNLRMDLFEELISTAPAPTFSTLSSVYWRTDTSGAQWHSQVAECKLTNNLQQKVGSLNSHEPKVLLAAEEMRRCKGKKATMPEWHRRTKLQTSGQRGGAGRGVAGRGAGHRHNTQYKHVFSCHSPATLFLSLKSKCTKSKMLLTPIAKAQSIKHL